MDLRERLPSGPAEGGADEPTRLAEATGRRGAAVPEVNA
jgi:hypothetical protein